MKEAESRVGLVPCACWGDHITLTWPKCGIFMALFSGFVGAGLLFPYIITVVRKIMPPFLPLIRFKLCFPKFGIFMVLFSGFVGASLLFPYIPIVIRKIMTPFSNAGGIPPSNGVFAVFVLLGAFFGFIAFFLLFETISHRNVKDRRIIRKLNKIGYIIATLSCFGFVVVVCYPVGYTDLPNMFEWVTTVLFEHGIAATVILVGAAVYQFILGGIWWILPDASKTDKYIKLGFIGAYLILFLITVYPLPAYILQEFGPNPLDFARFKTISYNLPVVYTTNFIICAACEYAICILSCVNFVLLSKDLQRVSLRVVLRPKSCLAEEEPPVPSIQLKVLA